MDYNFQDMSNLASMEELSQSSGNLDDLWLSLLPYFDFIRDDLGLNIDIDLNRDNTIPFHDVIPPWFINETRNFSEFAIDFLYDELLNSDNDLEDQVQPNGLLQDIIEKLPQKTQIDAIETCTICKDNYKEEDCVINLPCDHYFHKSCLVPWFESHSTCPMCRKIIS